MVAKKQRVVVRIAALDTQLPHQDMALTGRMRNADGLTSGNGGYRRWWWHRFTARQFADQLIRQLFGGRPIQGANHRHDSIGGGVVATMEAFEISAGDRLQTGGRPFGR